MKPRSEDGGSLGEFALPKTDLGIRTSDLGIFLHASSVVVDGGAVLFLGHTTAGKSTIVRLLGQAYPVLADDSVYAVRRREGDWRVVDGSFRFGRDELPGWQEEVRLRAEGAGAVPLRGCFRIHKAETVKIEPLAPVDLARYLMDAAMEIDLQRKAGRPSPQKGGAVYKGEAICQRRRQWFHWVAEIARGCPGWHLWFSKDTHFRELCATLSSLTASVRRQP
jgi:energy-coupling factor transporter ATP-binding protein EcfA2